MSAVLALAGTLGGVWLGGLLSSSNQTDQFNEQRQKVSREQREKVYFVAYARAQDVENAYIGVNSATDHSPSYVPPLLERKNEKAAMKVLAEATKKFYDSLTGVSVYGSDEAVRLAELIRAAGGKLMEPLVFPLRKGEEREESGELNEFHEVLDEFSLLMCRELAAIPRPGCFGGHR